MLSALLPASPLEDWMREYYFATELDIGGSGVEDYSMAELRSLLGISLDDLDQIVFHDSKTLGGAAVRQAIASRWGGGKLERAIVTHGATEANFMVMNALLDQGDEVVVLDPMYQQLFSIAESLGCRVRRWKLRYEDGFRPDLGEARQLIGPSTRMVVVNFPHNPTGATVTLTEQEELIRICAQVGAYLVWDMASTDLTFGAEPPLADPGLTYERGVSMGTLSKAYGLPGLRVGWCLAAPEVLKRFMRIRDYLTLHLSPLVELIAQRAIERGDLLLEPRRSQARRNRDIVSRWILEQGNRAEWAPAAGGVCGFPRFNGIRDAEEFCHRLARTERVLLVPGNCFGFPRHVRLGFGGATRDLQEGLRRVSGLLASEVTAD
jgi:capreomycidine synthase